VAVCLQEPEQIVRVLEIVASRFCEITIADISDAIEVVIHLATGAPVAPGRRRGSRIRHAAAVVTAISDPVAVGIVLIHVRNGGAVVDRIRDQVSIDVGADEALLQCGLSRHEVRLALGQLIVGSVGERVADVTELVPILIRLIGVGLAWTVVSIVLPFIAVTVFCIVAGITDAASVRIGLVGVGYFRAVVSRVFPLIPIRVLQVVTGITQAAVIGVQLIRVCRVDAIISAVVPFVTITILRVVAGVAPATTVSVCLVRVWCVGTVIEEV
jgi:hypothetical protein